MSSSAPPSSRVKEVVHMVLEVQEALEQKALSLVWIQIWMLILPWLSECPWKRSVPDRMLLHLERPRLLVQEQLLVPQ
jgi:hypothetical protein